MASKIISAYYNFAPDGSLQPEGINGNLMTHLLVGWIRVDKSTGMIVVPPGTIDGLKRCVLLKTRFPHLKVMTVFGDQSGCIACVANNSELLNNFVVSVLELLGTCELDGLDIDWEFPVWNGHDYDRRNFITLLSKLREAFGSTYLLTAAVAAQKLVVDPAYDIPEMAPLVDFVNLMCYDFNFFTYYNMLSSHNSPLFSRPEQKLIFETMNTSWAADYWLSKGMPRNKIVIGIPTGDSISYPVVMDILVNDGGIRVFDRNAQVPYLYKGRSWVSYEDEESVAIKAKWIKKEGYGGAMIFAADMDDFNGVFSKTGTKFPLMDTVAKIVIPGGPQKL